MYSEISNFDKFNDFVSLSFEELYFCEQTFRNQICVEKDTAYVQNNAENLEKLLISLTALQCYQEFLNNSISFIRTKLGELERVTICFENNFKGPEYVTPKDIGREDLYHFILYVNSKMQMIGELVNDMNSSLKEMKKTMNSQPFEKLAQLMMKHLELLEGIETKILFLNEQVQKVIFLEMLVMKNQNLKLKLC